MTFQVILKRILRVLYPATVFLSLAVTWNASGQSPHPIDVHFLRLSAPFERSPLALIQAIRRLRPSRVENAKQLTSFAHAEGAA